MRSPSRFPRIGLYIALSALLALQACGGGGGDGIGSGGTGISGAVVKGPVANAAVVAFAIRDGQPGDQIGSAVTDANGNFSMSTGGWRGPVMLQASGGTFRDEASGASMSMGSGDVMTAALAGGAATAGVQLTPITSMAQARARQMAGGMTDANIAAANTALGNYFLAGDILHVPPMNPLVPGSGAGAGADSRNYGMTLAAMSQYAKSLGMANTSALVTSMMGDASDGTMNGMMGSAPVPMNMGGMMGSSMMPANAGSSALAAAMTAFAASAPNVSGVTATDIAPLAQKLSASGGSF